MKWRPKYKIGQFVYAFYKDNIYYGRIVTIHEDRTYDIKSENLITVPEMFIAKSIRKMTKHVIGKDAIYSAVLIEYLKTHLKGIYATTICEDYPDNKYAWMVLDQLEYIYKTRSK